jgi:hypothetical protein
MAMSLRTGSKLLLFWLSNWNDGVNSIGFSVGLVTV